MSLVAMSGSQPGGGFTETLKIRFNRDVLFSSYPSFLLDVPAGVTTDGAFQVDFFDGSSTVPLRKINPAPAQALPYSGKLTFIGGFFTPFRAKAGQTYQGRLVSGPPANVDFVPVNRAQTLDLPATRGVSGYVYAGVQENTVTSPATPGITGAIDVPATRTGSGSCEGTSRLTIRSPRPSFCRSPARSTIHTSTWAFMMSRAAHGTWRSRNPPLDKAISCV
jgi:hypothetical protein